MALLPNADSVSMTIAVVVCHHNNFTVEICVTNMPTITSKTTKVYKHWWQGGSPLNFLSLGFDHCSLSNDCAHKKSRLGLYRSSMFHADIDRGGEWHQRAVKTLQEVWQISELGWRLLPEFSNYSWNDTALSKTTFAVSKVLEFNTWANSLRSPQRQAVTITNTL